MASGLALCQSSSVKGSWLLARIGVQGKIQMCIPQEGTSLSRSQPGISPRSQEGRGGLYSKITSLWSGTERVRMPDLRRGSSQETPQ